MILNLSNNFQPLIGEEFSFEMFTFSGGEPHIKITPTNYKGRVTITHRINSFNDLGLLLISVDALNRLGYNELELFLPYFPGARQDRVMIKGEPLTSKVYADLINQLGFKSVAIFDVHSDVTPALIKNCKVLSNHLFIKNVMAELPNNMAIVSPDAGALKKIYNLAAFLNVNEIVECGKHRDVKTGFLSGFSVPIQDLKGKHCLIVDDICDGGGTFIGLAEELKKRNSGKLFLAVSHGIFSKGYTDLLEYFEKIFTTNSIKEIEQDKICQIPIKQLLNFKK